MNDVNEININVKRLKLLDLNINHILTLVKIYLNTNKKHFDYDIDDEDIKYLQSKKCLLVYRNKSTKYVIRTKGQEILDEIVTFKHSLSKETEKLIFQDKIDDFENKVKVFRSKFNGLKLGSMGVLADVKTKLKRWMKSNPEVTFKEILQATDLYIESLNGNYNYLQRADYFIYKQNKRKEETSRLTLFIEELNKETVNSDWGSEIV